MLYFVRHGQSQANLDGVFAGPRLPTSLTAHGVKQAEQEAQRLRDESIHIDQIVASPLERALHTAQIIARDIAINPENIRIDLRFTEYDMGELSGEPKTGVTPLQKVSAPGAEDPKVFRSRVKIALDDAALLPGNTLIVSHSGVGRMIEAITRDLDPIRFYELPDYPNAQVIKLEIPQ